MYLVRQNNSCSLATSIEKKKKRLGIETKREKNHPLHSNHLFIAAATAKGLLHKVYLFM